MHTQHEVDEAIGASWLDREKLNGTLLQNELVTRRGFLKYPKSAIPGGTAKITRNSLSDNFCNSIPVQVDKFDRGLRCQFFRVNLAFVLVCQGIKERISLG